MKKIYSKFGGIIAGSLYGLAMRLLFDNLLDEVFLADLFSVTFVWIVPIIIGLTTLIFSTKQDLENTAACLFRPALAVLFFFLICLASRLEDVICIVVIALPFMVVAAISGVLFAGFIVRYRERKGIIYSVFLIPILTGIIEPHFDSPVQVFETTSVTKINAVDSVVWNNIVRVSEIKDFEFKKGFFNYAGIPRPLYAELDYDTLGGQRVGHFDGGLRFNENIKEWDKNRHVSFDINVVPFEKKGSIFERHMLNGKHFQFINATYELEDIGDGSIQLSLTTKYQLETHVNFYGQFWGQMLLSDFQERLIDVIKNRCEET